ncbi:TIGR02594 family protein [Lewinella sp. W8]|uniref:TIGR02594 family protein n=1 Tax=Lewinella sp. W8 TaxID=2528208 RepID=UPI001067C870|nr:TIGR02594 family protein [Lewinella sp. W8]MTB53046.1 TIGR02594 family protein [Lewinella sp. W8]
MTAQANTVKGGFINPDLLYNALSYIGNTEEVGPKSNEVILNAIHTLFPGWRDDSTIAWCSCFTHLIAINVCGENPLQTGHKAPGTARSWLTVGDPVETPLPGDIVVYWRGSKNSWQGHVGFYCNRIGDKIFTLGGNQANSITVSAYSANRLLGFRRLRPAPEFEPNIIP